VAREFGLTSVTGLVERLRSGPGRELEARVIEAMTINETLWFRDVKPFKALREEVIPEAIARNEPARRLAIWSAAASTGQELYSVAMLLEQHFPELDGWNLSLIGTDINAAVLDKARAGRFSKLEINRGLPADMMDRYFTLDGGQYVIDESLRRRVSYFQLNLAGRWPARLPKFDVILLRNVLIYFDNPTRERIIASASKQLRRGGGLLLGSTETVVNISTDLVARTVAGTTVYEKGAA
jgi:chemotaxis protein methyltransferase CheR